MTIFIYFHKAFHTLETILMGSRPAYIIYFSFLTLKKGVDKIEIGKYFTFYSFIKGIHEVWEDAVAESRVWTNSE